MAILGVLRTLKSFSVHMGIEHTLGALSSKVLRSFFINKDFLRQKEIINIRCGFWGLGVNKTLTSCKLKPPPNYVI